MDAIRHLGRKPTSAPDSRVGWGLSLSTVEVDLARETAFDRTKPLVVPSSLPSPSLPQHESSLDRSARA